MLLYVHMMNKIYLKLHQSSHARQIAFIVCSFLLLTLLLLASAFDDRIFALAVFGLIFALFSLFIAFKYTQYAFYFVMIWIAFESFLLKFIPVDWYAYVKYAPEMLLYTMLGLLVFKHVFINKKDFIHTPINILFIGFVSVCLLSSLLNGSSLFIAVLGIRQLIRFFFIYYLALYAGLQKKSVYVMLTIGAVIAGFEALLGIVQYMSGGALDTYLLPDRNVLLGAGIVIDGVEQFWEGGQRIFATFGRYDRLGSFLAICFITLVAALYEHTFSSNRKKALVTLLVAIGVAIVLTYSRATWLATLVGSLLVSVGWKRDRRVLVGLVVMACMLFAYVGYYLAITRTSLSVVTDLPDATLTERFLEAFSRSSLENSYEGLGRVYFIVNTPLRVVPSAPLFGVGPGYYGGGVAAALGNTEVYNELGLPFGVYGEIGQIDNNWFSIWGETGTIGLVLYALMFIMLWHGMVRFFREQYKDMGELERMLALSVIGIVPALMLFGLFAPYFEMRTLMFYVMLLIGCAYSVTNYQYKIT